MKRKFGEMTGDRDTWKITEDTKIFDKVLGAVAGHALGDALGAPFEFGSKGANVYTGSVKDVHLKRGSRFQGIRTGPEGMCTDDTMMALCLLQSLQKNQGLYVESDVITHYAEFAAKCSFMGRNTKVLLHNIKTEAGFRKRFHKRFQTQEAKDQQQSNGCLMRCYPLAFLYLQEGAEWNDVRNAVYCDSVLTNPNEICANACWLYVKAVALALKGNTRSEIRLKIQEEVNALNHACEPLKLAFQKACIGEHHDVTDKTGWVVHAWYCAFWGLFQFDNYKMAVDAIIGLGPSADKQASFMPGSTTKKGLKGDTDTNAAIAGALLGAFYGVAEMKKCHTTCINLNITLNCNPKGSKFLYEEKYMPFNFTLSGQKLPALVI